MGPREGMVAGTAGHSHIEQQVKNRECELNWQEF